MTTHTDLFIKNVNQWAVFSPKNASALLDLKRENTTLCQTEAGEQNLKIKDPKASFYLHFNTNAQQEAEDWFSSLDLYSIQNIFVLGVGLGYYYQATKKWLLEDKNRHLVFLEDNLEVISHLFETDLGREMMRNRQVRLFFIEKNKDGKMKGNSLEAIPSTYFLKNHVYSCLNTYALHFPKLANDCERFLGYYKNYKRYQVMEQISYGKGFFGNFYRNVLELPNSKFADNMFGRFKGMPAIVCGAGPSLQKNLPLLEKLKDQACIIAGGSAMNVVNVNGFNPHFGIALDPNLSQYSRLFMNQAYEVPYFYRNRVFPEALTLLHGEHLYVSGSGGYGIARWFEEQLGLKSTEISEGKNVVNFGISIAEALGCNPIILVGADMAYTESESYASGILSHPVLDLDHSPKTRGINEEVVERLDIYGKPVHTLWKWISESVWIAQFAMSHKETQIINATEGGIGVESIPNLTLEKVVDKHLAHAVDLDALFHLEIQNSHFPETVTREKALELMRELKASLLRSREYCKVLTSEFTKVLESLQSSGEKSPRLITDEAMEILKKLNQEAAFAGVLNSFNESFLSIYGRDDLEQLYKDQDQRIDQTEVNRRRTKLNYKRYKFLKAVCKANAAQIDQTVNDDRVRSVILSGIKKVAVDKEKGVTDASKVGARLEHETYQVENGHYIVEDSELQVSLKGKVLSEPVISIKEEDKAQFFQQLDPSFTGVLQLLNSDGKVELSQQYQQGRLHGPSTGYFRDGTFSSRCFYENGVKQGKALFYYPSGALYSMLSYKNGTLVGRQEYFYEEGNLKTLLQYLAGQLHGEATFYFSSGVLKRTLSYDHGKREGKEIIWNVGGIKEVEINYHQDKPVGFVRSWHLNGYLAREIEYDQDSKPISVSGWTVEGKELPTELLIRDDYFEKIAQRTKNLTGSIEQIYGHFNQVTPQIEEASQNSFSEEMKELKEEMDNLRELHKRVEKQSEEATESAKEALWKTPDTKRILGKQLADVSEKMVEDIGTIEYSLKILDELLKRNKDE